MAASSTIFWVFGMTWPGIEPQSPGSLANTLLICYLTLIVIFAHSVMVSSIVMTIYCLHTVKWFQALLSNTNDSR